VLQDHKFERLGGEKTLEVEVRILAATNKDLLEEVENGNFREDLFYRLKVIPIHIPPLKQRRNDIPLLARHFLHRFALDQKKEIQDISRDAMRLLLDYSWPGNVRELENIIEHALIVCQGEIIERHHLPLALQQGISQAWPVGDTALPDDAVEISEKQMIMDMLQRYGWNKGQTAAALNIDRTTLWRKIKKYNISR